MIPSDVAGVFSRYFVVGFFLPAFFAFATLVFGLSSDALPNRLEDYSDAATVATVGGVALLVALVLLGVNYQVMRAFEGYPLVAAKDRWLIRQIHDWLIKRQHERYDALVAQSETKGPDADEAAWLLDRYFSKDPDKRLLPTAFGNAVRAFERHSRTRWGLNGIAAWPRIEMLLDDKQRELQADAQSTVAFMLNGAVLAIPVGLILLVDLFVNCPVPWYLAWLYLVPFLVAVAAHRASVGAAIGWGSSVRAAVDLKRRQLYRELGVRTPTTLSEERDVIAPAINRALLYAIPMPDELSQPIEEVSTDAKED